MTRVFTLATLFALLFALFTQPFCPLATLQASEQSTSPLPLRVEQADGIVRIKIDDQPFAAIDFKSYAKPIVYPIYGPGQIPMTRNFPMKKGIPGEATDHPHHKSMWFGHGDVNGISFWHEQGKIITDKVDVQEDPHSPTVTLYNRLVGPDGELIARETARITFRAYPDRRMIDWDVTLQALDKPLRLGDTKEGTMALRVHPSLRMDNDPKRGVTTASGKAVNSEGVTGREVWGKAARWVDFFGQVDGQDVGIAFLDHPQNLRHPTRWHARTYGLFAANPFGLSQFVGPGNDGSYSIPAGGKLRLRYRVVFHRGAADQKRIEQWFAHFASE